MSLGATSPTTDLATTSPSSAGEDIYRISDLCKLLDEYLQLSGDYAGLEVLRFYMVGGSEFSNFMDSAARFKLKEGTSRLIELILEDGGADVQLSSPVKSIEDHGDFAQVTTLRGEELRAKAVVSTLPMNTMANVNFKPALPKGVVDAAHRRHPGRGGGPPAQPARHHDAASRPARRGGHPGAGGERPRDAG